jgi:transposase InsO family protein
MASRFGSTAIIRPISPEVTLALPYSNPTTPEFITPYTPEQNGIVERFFRSLKEECVWQHNFH